jgi:hypothetical protein
LQPPRFFSPDIFSGGIKMIWQQALQQVSSLLGIPAQWLDSLIAFESNRNPTAKAAIPYNLSLVKQGKATPEYARGLIQFIKPTAQALGFKDQNELVEKYPDAADQLTGPVYNYLKQFKPFPWKQSFYMAVFYPEARNWPPGQRFPSYVTDSNPKIKTPQDYIDLIDKKKRNSGASAALLIIAAIAIVYFYLNKGDKNGRENESRPE